MHLSIHGLYVIIVQKFQTKSNQSAYHQTYTKGCTSGGREMIPEEEAEMHEETVSKSNEEHVGGKSNKPYPIK